MARFDLHLALTGVVLTVVGCGTMANFDVEGRRRAGRPAPPTAFGGVSRDFKYAGDVMSADCPGLNKMVVGMPMCAIYLIDAPFSLVADTLTLPLVLAADRAETGEDSRPEPESP